MLKAIIIVCPIYLRKTFYENLFELLNSSESKISFIRYTPEVTEKINGLQDGKDYTFVERDFFEDTLKNVPDYYIAQIKTGLNGHAKLSGFPIESFHMANSHDETIIYDTWEERLAKKVQAYYKDRSKITPMKFVIDSLGVENQIKKHKMFLIQGPDTAYKVFDYVLDLNKKTLV